MCGGCGCENNTDITIVIVHFYHKSEELVSQITGSYIQGWEKECLQ